MDRGDQRANGGVMLETSPYGSGLQQRSPEWSDPMKGKGLEGRWVALRFTHPCILTS
jgi:hypothetical protein